MPFFRFSSTRLAGAAIGIALSAGAPDARACGGTFCDTGPQAMPVDQTGENVVFVMADGIVEAHVQIQYQGDPERFAWIVPMQRVPEVTVGSEALFDALLGATVPSYGFSTTRDQCDDTSNRKSTSGSAFDADGESSGAAPHVLFEKTVGSFEVAALSGGTAGEVVQWLDANGYQQADTGPAILQRYIDKSFVFVAVKLTAGAGIAEIHPLVFSYAGTEPCIPLELTAVAAIEDMGVRTFFLGTERVVPTNYRHVLVNPLKIDWRNFGANYREVIAEAVDVENADGQAFVTEYAGPSTAARALMPSMTWDASRFATATPATVLALLSGAGLGDCAGGSCAFTHPLVRGILGAFLPPPAGVLEEEYWSCTACYAAQADLTAWNSQSFARAVEERIATPARHAVALLAEKPYLTRLFTLISPDEMTLDPMFREESSLPEVPLPGLATQRILCSGASIFTLPDGRQVWLDSSAEWPSFDGMSPAMRIESFSLPGAADVLSNHEPAIDTALEDHNDAFRGRQGCGCVVPGRSDRPGRPFGLAVGLGAAALVIARRRRGRRRGGTLTR